MNEDIWRRRQKLERLFERAGKIDDMEMQAQMARYLCILTSGFMEASVRALFSQYTRAAANAKVTGYVEQQLKYFQSASMGNICALTRSFSDEWSAQLEAETEGELKDAVNSIVANRHLLSHGGDAGIGLVQMREYYTSAIKVIDLLRRWCDPEPRSA
ncbi:MAG TPA: HEPN domain-containing protein [Dehalococcoidia bacterium]